jgi:cation diffusion facilitator CzcD-associated flavoprotein CzcO
VSLEAIIIGAGPSGMATAACLEREKIRYALIDKSTAVGASWRGHYERLHLHTVKELSHLPYASFPREYPRYVARAQFVEYLESYARQFNLRPELGQEVRSARREEDQWIVETDRRTYTAKRLIVATGYSRKPKMPTWPGQERFRGELIHSSRYRSGSDYKDKRALVVGMGNSGAEIALDLVEQGAIEPAISVRSPTHVVPRDLYGIPAQWTGLMLSKLPRKVADAIGVRAAEQYFGDLSRYGIHRPRLGPISQVVEKGRIPVIDVGTIDAIKSNKLSVYPGIECFEEETVVFTDGKRRLFDLVVLATGYEAALDDFLACAKEVTDDRGYPKVHGAESAVPGLYFLGFRNPPTGQLRDINLEARAITAHIQSTMDPGGG